MDRPRVRGLFEAHLSVAAIDRSLAFYVETLGLTVAQVFRERDAAFVWTGPPGSSMLGLWGRGAAPMTTLSHVALAVDLADVLSAPRSLRAAAVEPLSFFEQPADEPSVLAWMPAAAVYFRDPDGHLLEYVAMLDAPPEPELGIVTWSAWGGR